MARTPTELRSSLQGLIGFGVTPFHQDFKVDVESLRQNAAHLARYCDVVVALGNNGEIFSLSVEEQKLVGRNVVEEVGKRKPVLVGTGFSLPDTCELVRAAEASGPTASWFSLPTTRVRTKMGFLRITRRRRKLPILE